VTSVEWLKSLNIFHLVTSGGWCHLLNDTEKLAFETKLQWSLGSLELMRQSLQIEPTFVAVKQHKNLLRMTTSLRCSGFPESIMYRLAVLVFRCRNHTAPEYLTRDLHWVADDDFRRRLRSATTHQLMVRYRGRGSAPSAIVRLELPALVCGMIYHLQSPLRHRWPCSRRILRLTFFGSPTVTDVNAL